ncbi:HAMP domain-containing histidine kinase [Vibrio aestuarianus]|uniref:sensor histidine kinase n=1 Tax=Vibrio aestuarianus TaxID=28171 RepID=UPI00237CE0CB|nr:HAMP domain-containing sensor histidine kinase [Vibrio aestuarianus]MDE1253191.1 HAMP domain-containing histidine kinase [Vibrio aestuarianus]MDE1351120.1 HAMP domain-containing histidine kinase [Vibrio aestuarianus]
MRRSIINNTRTLTGRLALFFTGLSLVLGFVIYAIFYTTLHWSEDRVGERRILIDKEEAIYRFNHGESGYVKIDILTDAYNDLELVPSYYKQKYIDHDTFLGEIGEGESSRMVLFGSYYHEGEKKPLILLSKIDELEFRTGELFFSGIIVLSCVAALMLIFGGLLYRLSRHLIEPINNLIDQLNNHKGNAQHTFTISDGAATEFELLTKKMNQYRRDIQLLIKREQSFGRYASHELRTPLTIIKGANALLALNPVSEFQKRQLVRIEDATSQMSTIVDALLGLVRYERNPPSAPNRLLLQHEFIATINNSRMQAGDKNIDIEFIFHSSPSIKATAPVIEMIVGNLLRNAIAATRQGKITITLSQAELIIQDQGMGLSDQSSEDGHGLGLLIVSDLCQRYGWFFSLSNHEQGGCIARICFQEEHADEKPLNE